MIEEAIVDCYNEPTAQPDPGRGLRGPGYLHSLLTGVDLGDQIREQLRGIGCA